MKHAFIYALCLLLGTPTIANAQHASSHAPIGVMGDHMHKEGEWMLSYRHMHMNMEGNRKGTDSISAQEIATTEPNRFFGVAGQPSTLRVVPIKMQMKMHMFGAMYAPSDRFTLMGMANYIEKEMNHLTFAGGAGTTVRGAFKTQNQGWGDTKLATLVRLYDDETHHLHANLGVSLPTGTTNATGTVLAPNGATPRLRLPYSMQLGSGTFDALPGLTYRGHNGDWGWGAQYSAEIRMEDENDDNYALGDKHTISTWIDYDWADWVSTSARVSAYTQDSIDGIDPQIVAPVQTADPDNYGGDIIDLSLGMNLLGQKGHLKDHRLAIEATVPLYRDLNGPQLETDMTLTLGWQYAF